MLATNRFTPLIAQRRPWVYSLNLLEHIRKMTTVDKPHVATIIPKDLSSKLRLADGNEMPFYGLGVFQASKSDTVDAVVHALKNGYRLIDTAQYYENEEGVGEAIKKSGIPRSEIFVTTKLLQHGYDICKTSFMESLKKLQLEYVDLFLIHNPQGGKNLESYDAMVELQKQGLIKSIGVSNFNVIHLEEFRKAGKPTPAVNQIELHPYLRQTEIVKYCLEHNIAVMGFTPLTRGKKLDDPPLVEIAKKYNKTTAEILLRWSVQKGYITIPKSINPERIVANSKVFDFWISEEDMQKMETFPEERCTKVTTDQPWLG